MIDFDEVSTRIAGEICGQCHAYFSPTDWNEFAKSVTSIELPGITKALVS